MEAVISQLTSKEAMKLITQLENVFKTLPHLPQGIVEFLVKIAPWFALLGGVFGILGALSALSAGLGMTGYSAWMQLAGFSSIYFLVNGAFQLVAAALLLLSFKYLKERALTGWVLVFWEMVVSAGMMIALLVLSGGFGLSGFVGILIGFYILFELKSSYTSKE